MKLTGIILAGGLSTRMGRDKAGLPWGESDLLHTVLSKLAPICNQLVVVSNQPRTINISNVVLVADDYPQCGPLAGMHAGLLTTANDYNFVVACDMPYLNTAAAAYIAQAAAGYDAAVPFIDGYFHPLHAVYHRNCLPYIEQMLVDGNYRVLDFYPDIKLRRIAADELRVFDDALVTLRNINTPAEFIGFKP